MAPWCRCEMPDDVEQTIRERPMHTKVLMVDVDGVIVRHPHPEGWAANLERDLGLSKKALQEGFFRRHWGDVVHGRASLRDRLEASLAVIAPHLSAETLISYWFANDAFIDKDLYEQLSHLRSVGVEMHLATVQEHERAAYTWDVMALKSLFSAIHYAAEIGICKPHHEFYKEISRRVSAERIFFIDDSAPNVKAARDCGWRAELWEPGASLADLFPDLLSA